MNQTQDPKLPFWKFLVGFVLLEVAIVALSAIGSGCSTVDPDAVYEIYTNIVVRIPDSPAQDAKKGEASTSGSAGESGSSSVVLDFKYGGFKGGKAKEDSRCRLGSPKITKDKISWKWLTKIPSDWKRKDTKKGPMVIAAAFYWDGSKWVGGKTDFCDESRSSRSATNIHEGYNGWNASAWDSAKKRAFCVVSADGKYRSNLIED